MNLYNNIQQYLCNSSATQGKQASLENRPEHRNISLHKMKSSQALTTNITEALTEKHPTMGNKNPGEISEDEILSAYNGSQKLDAIGIVQLGLLVLNRPINLIYLELTNRIELKNSKICQI